MEFNIQSLVQIIYNEVNIFYLWLFEFNNKKFILDKTKLL